MAVVAGGKAALTHYRLIEAAGTIGSRLHLTLGSGRTHQIRVHLGVIGLGIIGDPVYRPRRRPRLSAEFERMVKRFDRIALHARRLGFEHPITGEQKCFEQAPPEIFGNLFEQLQMEANAFISR